MEFSYFYPFQTKESKEKYTKLLLGISQVSKMFSKNPKPYLPYRAAENIFCTCFSAKDVSRKDQSVDAVKEINGIGIKTFLSNGVTKHEKIAEFDDPKKYHFNYKSPSELARQVASYRNRRLENTIKTYQLKQTLYHYLVRDIGKILICECPMLPIDEKSIELAPATSQHHIVRFNDKFFAYYFHLTKHTLYQAFITNKPLEIVTVPLKTDDKLLIETIKELTGQKEGLEASFLETKEYVILPLYSTKLGEVPQKSGLNQWNAGGRSRDLDEVYIPIPSIVHKTKPRFFPPRNKKFILKTPNGKDFLAKVWTEPL
jgi:hypothetical protein